MGDGAQVLCYQWKNRKLLVTFLSIIRVLSSRRACRALLKLLPLFEDSPKIKVTFQELATLMGYKNRSGSHKAIKLLERLGVVAYKDGYLNLTMGEVLLKTYDE